MEYIDDSKNTSSILIDSSIYISNLIILSDK
jgi:hypothetical protein